ncbi:hypothetical protein V8G54_020753, partial [Vigna mungo]
MISSHGRSLEGWLCHANILDLLQHPKLFSFYETILEAFVVVQDQEDGPQVIPMACTHRPIIFDLHQHNIQLDSLDFYGAKDSTLKLQQEILCSLVIHFCQVASQLLPCWFFQVFLCKPSQN